MRSQEKEARALDQRGATTHGLLRSIALDPHGGWEALVARTHARLRVLAHFLLAGAPARSADVDDVLQETWSEALLRFERFEYRGSGSFQRWIAGILRMKVLEAQRSRARGIRIDSARVDVRRLAGDARALALALERVQSSASADARRRELEERVRAALGVLPESERAALLLVLYEGLSVREAGARAGVDPATISLRAKSGLRRCAHLLRGFEP